MNTARKMAVVAVKGCLTNAERKARIMELLQNGTKTYSTLKEFINLVNEGTETQHHQTYYSLCTMKKEGIIDWEIETEIFCTLCKFQTLKPMTNEKATYSFPHQSKPLIDMNKMDTAKTVKSKTKKEAPLFSEFDKMYKELAKRANKETNVAIPLNTILKGIAKLTKEEKETVRLFLTK